MVGPAGEADTTALLQGLEAAPEGGAPPGGARQGRAFAGACLLLASVACCAAFVARDRGLRGEPSADSADASAEAIALNALGSTALPSALSPRVASAPTAVAGVATAPIVAAAPAATGVSTAVHGAVSMPPAVGAGAAPGTAPLAAAATAALATAPPGGDATCTKFNKEQWTLCPKDCGHCFNAGGRSGAICNAGTMTGYLCPPEPQGGDAAFACMDWTFGSAAMRQAEAGFAKETGEDVFFGVGTFGVPKNLDQQQGLGACYRMKVEGVSRDIIAQSLNTGSDVAGNQFDLQIGAGGAGIFNTCVGGGQSMFPGAGMAWGCQYGGVDNRSACSALPPYPRSAGPMRAAGDDLRTLCEYSWDQGVRLSGGTKPTGQCKFNPTLLDVSRVRCPSQLADITWFQRADDPDGYRATAAHRIEGFPNARHKCSTAALPVGNSSFCLTRMMDCRKPSGAWITNVHSELMVPGRKVLQTCTADGYTRIDVQCGCFDCNC